MVSTELNHAGDWAEQLVTILERNLSRRGLAGVREHSQAVREFRSACEYIVRCRPVLGIVTGFFIPQAGAWESDGPPGAVFLGRCLAQLGYTVCLYAEADLAEILRWALQECSASVAVVAFPDPQWAASWWPAEAARFGERTLSLVCIERPGPAHTPNSLAQACREPHVMEEFLACVPETDWDRLHTMSGQDVTAYHWPVHAGLESSPLRLLAIGDGGNEIGMGKLPWPRLAQAIPQGARIACRIPADWLILAPVSNWGAYALAAALCLLHRDWVLFSRLAHAERDLWLEVCRAHLLCDGVTGQLANHDDDFWVDGFPWRVHAAILDEITGILRTSLP